MTVIVRQHRGLKKKITATPPSTPMIEEELPVPVRQSKGLKKIRVTPISAPMKVAATTNLGASKVEKEGTVERRVFRGLRKVTLEPTPA